MFGLALETEALRDLQSLVAEAQEATGPRFDPCCVQKSTFHPLDQPNTMHQSMVCAALKGKTLIEEALVECLEHRGSAIVSVILLQVRHIRTYPAMWARPSYVGGKIHGVRLDVRLV